MPGCPFCEQTGYVAERREGTTYPTPCPKCNMAARDGRYHFEVREYALKYNG